MDDSDCRKVHSLRCAIQQYAWGKFGRDSKVAQLSQVNPDFLLEEDKPYAELWMGTHPRGLSVLVDKEESLAKWISDNPECLGDKVRLQFGDQLPFLFKVLSVNKSLSIQAHPNKKHAEELHSSRPDKYPDPNHKPEIAIALTKFEAMCGFRPVKEINNFLDQVPEFADIIGQETGVALRSLVALSGNDNDNMIEQALQECFTKLMTCDDNVVKVQLEKLINRIKKMQQNNENIQSCCGELILRLNSQFPGDVGCFCVFMLNHIILQHGEAIFLGPNIPHAYLSGDCIECMSCSDNVVRAGLTPKYKDVSTLCQMLDFKPGSIKDNIFTSYAHPKDPFVTVYNPPVDDFGVTRIKIPAGCTEYTIEDMSGPSIAIVTEGKASTLETDQTLTMHFNPGTVVFIPCDTKIMLKCDGSSDIVIFRAFCVLS